LQDSGVATVGARFACEMLDALGFVVEVRCAAAKPSIASARGGSLAC
jgi:hypothetical protein